MGTENNTTKEQLKFEEIKDELGAIVASLDEYNKDIPLDKLSDIASLAKSYGIYDNLAKIYEVSQDKDIPSAIAVEVAKMGGAAAGVWTGVQVALSFKITHPVAVILAGATGAFLGEQGVKQYEQEIKDFVKNTTDSQTQKYLDFQLLSPEDKARYITNGGVPWGYASSSSVVVRIDPLVLDLNHDGIVNSISLSSSKTFFDMNNDGMSELTGWISADDGMVVYDKNQDGKIDSNNEMFGKTGLDGLSELKNIADSNHDNVFDKNDTLFGTLKIWQDTNQDGISQSDELKTFDELNISSVNLKSIIKTNINSNGNAVISTS